MPRADPIRHLGMREPSNARVAWCIYCGLPVRGRRSPLTCDQHRDLVKIDPHYTMPDQWKRARKL